MISEIKLDMEIVKVDTKILPLQYTWVQGEPTYGMSYGAFVWFCTRIKNDNVIRTLKSLNRKS